MASGCLACEITDGDRIPQTGPVLLCANHANSLLDPVLVGIAARRPVGGLILETPFNRLCEMAQIRYPVFPACLLLPYEHWDSANLIGQIDAPVLILHGDADKTIPLSQGQALFDAAPEPKRLIIYPGARHNDLRLYGAGIDAITFIEGLAGD